MYHRAEKCNNNTALAFASICFFVRSLLVLTAEMSRGAWFLSFRAAFPAVEQLRNASGRGCGGGSGGSGVLKAPGEKKSTHWFIGIDRQSYQPLQIYDGHFCAAARAERIIGLIALSSSAAFYLNFRRCQQKVWRLILFPPPVEKILDPCCLAQLWLSQWKIDEALQVDTKLSVLFINVLWLDPLAALCKLIAV